MADYYPLIARAIAGLDPSAPGESRRALYERARAALSTAMAFYRDMDMTFWLPQAEATLGRVKG